MNLEESNVYFKDKRDQYLINIHKKKNAQLITLKRKKFIANVTLSIKQEDDQSLKGLANSFMEFLKSKNYQQLSRYAELVRRAISNNEDPPINELIETGIVPHVIKLLENEYFKHEKLMAECAWIIANVASGASIHVDYLKEQGAIHKILQLLDHPGEDVKENAIWILANISGDSIENRDIALEMDIVTKLEALLDGKIFPVNFICHISWLISNLSRGKPYPPFSKVQPLLKIIQAFMTQTDNEEVHNNCLWALSYFSDGDDEQIEAVLDLGLTGKIIQHMTSQNFSLRAPALRAAGNLLTGRNDLCQIVIENGVIPALSKLLYDPKKIIRKEACWALSNIMAGTYYQIDEVFEYQNKDIIQKLFLMISSDDVDVVKEACICLGNACSEGSSEHLNNLVEGDILELFTDTLRNSGDEALIKACLEGINNILRGDIDNDDVGKGPYIQRFAACNGFDAIESLFHHPNQRISETAIRIAENYSELPQQEQ